MIALKIPSLGPALAAMLLVGGCTFNYKPRFERPPAPEETADLRRCSMVWSGVVPSGWTVDELNRFVAAIPAAGCPPVELTVHRHGADVDWNGGIADPPPDWIVRSALTQFAEGGAGPLRRVHAFAEPPAPEGEPPLGEGGGLKGDKGEPGEKGEKGDKGDDGRDGLDGQDGRDGKDGRDGRDGETGPPGRDAPAPPDAPDDPETGTPGQESARRGSGADPAAAGPSAWIARNAPPALVGGGLVYGMVYFNLLGASAVARAAPVASAEPWRRRARRPEEDDAEEAIAGALGAAAAAGDRRVRIRSSGFEGPSA